jgi:16S rRNA (guanine966-N2)-methyltransferase
VEIRPTPDRVRETLFNWLAPGIRGARCLDLFAGSGALGLEALSRGAGEVVFVEHSRVAALAIERLLLEWQGAGGSVLVTDALRFIERPAAAFDIVFLDPPFAESVLGPLLTTLVERHWLRPGALVYVEFAARSGRPPIPAQLTLHRQGRSGEVGYDLLRHSSGDEVGGR